MKKNEYDVYVENFLRDCDGKFSRTASRAKSLSKVDAKLFDSIIRDSDWNESDHPRDDSGKFSTAPGGGSTEDHYKKGGEWSPERREIHAKIINKALKGFKPHGGRPQAYILGGGSVSGKSSSFKHMRPLDTVNIDSDWMKSQIPEFDELKEKDFENAAFRVHEESSYLVKEAMAQAMADRLDFVYDSTGSGAKLPEVAKNLHSKGYKAHAMYFDVPIDVARERAIARANGPEGRVIPEDVLQATHKGSAAGFMRLVNSKHISTAHAYNTDVPRGEAPKLIYRRSGKEPGTVIDDKLWQEYRRKAGSMMVPYKKPEGKDSIQQYSRKHIAMDSEIFHKDSDLRDFENLLEEKMIDKTVRELLKKHA